MVACIKQIEYEPIEESAKLVVDGVIQAGFGPHLLILSRSGQLGQDTFPAVTDAVIFLYDQTGARFRYNHIGEGHYLLPAGIARLETGAEYFVEILLEDKTYRSSPEVIPEPTDIQEISFRIEGDQFILEIRNSASENRSLFLKWTLENIFEIKELPCHPFLAPHVCYIEDEFHKGSIPLLDVTQLQAGATFQYDIATKEIDYSFGNAQSFYVVQQVIGKEAFEYWSRVDLVSNQLGSLFDPQPASVRGNLYNVEDPTEVVFGYFGAIAQDEAVLFTTAGDFFEEFQILPYCGIPGFEIFEEGCCNCIELENASWEKPDYW